jgi:hypothetical protein
MEQIKSHRIRLIAGIFVVVGGCAGIYDAVNSTTLLGKTFGFFISSIMIIGGLTGTASGIKGLRKPN